MECEKQGAVMTARSACSSLLLIWVEVGLIRFDAGAAVTTCKTQQLKYSFCLQAKSAK